MDGVQLVEHDGAQMFEQPRGIAMRQEQRQLFGRGEQNIGRRMALALAAAGRRIAGAGFDADVESHFGDRVP